MNDSTATSQSRCRKFGNRQFGDRIRAARQRAGMSQGMLARAMDMESHSIIAQYELGYNMPSLSSFVRLCKVLNVSMDEIFRD